MKLKRRNRAPQSVASQCTRVRTPHGRTAHLKHSARGVLCGWRAEWADAGEALPTCLLCSDELQRLSGEGAP